MRPQQSWKMSSIFFSSNIIFKVIIYICMYAIKTRITIRMAPRWDCRKSEGSQPAWMNINLTLSNSDIFWYYTILYDIIWINVNLTLPNFDIIRMIFAHIKHVGNFFTMGGSGEINTWARFFNDIERFFWWKTCRLRSKEKDIVQMFVKAVIVEIIPASDKAWLQIWWRRISEISMSAASALELTRRREHEGNFAA